jgi:hypothetical protein
LQVHTGLGRNPDGSVDADSEYWKPYIEVNFSHTYLMFASTIYSQVMLVFALAVGTIVQIKLTAC